MRGIRYRKRVDGVASCLFFYFVIHLVTLFVMGADNVSVSSSGKKSRTFSDLLNIVGGLGGGGGKPEDKTFFGEDADGNEILVGTWFQYGSYTLATAMFGTGFLVACAATAVYYVLFVVTDPRQSGLTKSKRSLSSTTSAVDRIGKLFTTVDLAFDLYDRFDWSSDECRRRMWCHFNGGNSDEKRTFMPDWVKKSNYWNLLKVVSLDDATNLDCSEDTDDVCTFPFDEFGNKVKSLYD